MDKALKSKIIMFSSMIIFMMLYMVIFGNKNAVLGTTMVMAAFMNLGNDLSFKPKTSFIKILALLLILGIAAYLNNPLTIFGCILTFVVVFGTTFTSYHLFGTSVYLPFLMCYFMMVGIPVTLENLPMRLLSLAFGAVFIVGLNILVNKKKEYKLSKATIDNLIGEINNAIDLKLDGKEVSEDSFKTANGFYLTIFSKFEYKYFPTKIQQSVLNIIKSFQYIGKVLCDFNLSKNELEYIREVLSNVGDGDSEKIFKRIDVDTKEMHLVLLNLEIIANEIKNKDLTKDTILPDRKTILQSIKPIIKKQFSFKSVKFTFAFKMAIIMFVWQVLTLVFNLPFTKWLYFVTVPLMLPYIDDVAYTARTRVEGTFVGVFVFAIIIMIMPYLPISYFTLMMVVMVVCMIIMVLKMEDKLILATVTTIMSVMAALLYIQPPEAMFLKILWVVVGAAIVTLFNFKFMPYSVEIETKNNLKTCYDLNKKSIELVKQKCLGGKSSEKTTLLVVSNVVRENIEVTDENKELFELQIKITDVCNFILNYIDVHGLSKTLKDSLINIIDNDGEVKQDSDLRETIISYSMRYVMDLYKKEEKFFKN
ncbi:MAG: FUSC family protein [Methanobrevibacter sp.]|nr:FUSC family protein [Methanobrevibacter sp.]